jgi:hypothetical protein
MWIITSKQANIKFVYVYVVYIANFTDLDQLSKTKIKTHCGYYQNMVLLGRVLTKVFCTSIYNRNVSNTCLKMTKEIIG